MKLNNTLIVTLPDFARHFCFAEFWANRRQFVRDMHPSRVYYWSSELAEAYAVVAAWIEKNEDATDNDREAGRKALETLVGKPVAYKDITFSEVPDITMPIIRIRAGSTLDLPAYKHGGTSVRLRHHKIEVYGKSGTTAAVSIGGRHRKHIAAGSFACVTEAEGCGFVEFLPTHLKNSQYELTAISQEGELGCSLVVEDMNTMQQKEMHNVVSFALADDGYVYVTTDGKFITMSKFITGVRFLLEHDCDAFYVKSKGNEMAVLYADGTLKSPRRTEVGVISMRFDENGKLHYVKR